MSKVKQLIEKYKSKEAKEGCIHCDDYKYIEFIKELTQALESDRKELIDRFDKEIYELRDNLIIQYDKEQGLTETESNINTNTLAHWKLEGAKRASRMFYNKAKQIVNQVLDSIKGEVTNE